MDTVQQAPMTPNGLPSALRVGISGDDGSFRRRISEAIAEAGCDADVSSHSDGTDVLISAHERPDATACAEIRQSGKRNPEGVVILVVREVSAGGVRRALQAGAHAVVIEPLIESALIPSIGAALAGQIVMPADARRGGQPGVLTTREKQILGLVVMGMTNAEIAGKLFLAESTVKSHLSSAFAKLGVSSRSEAASVILDPQSGNGLGILTIPTG
jgi:DNA-binding NarL/FixJ family response regulator